MPDPGNDGVQKSALEQLLEAIVESYTIDEINRLVKIKMGTLLENDIAPGLPKRKFIEDVFGLFQRRKREGVFLSCIKNDEEQQQNDKLQQTIDKYLQWVATHGDVINVANVIGSKLLDSKEGRRIVADYLDRLNSLNIKIEVLNNLKRLHDCLHTLQVQVYRQIIDSAKRLGGSDPGPALVLSTQVDALATLCTSATEAAEGLPQEGEGRDLIIDWVNELKKAIPTLRRAGGDGDAHAALDATSSFRNIIEFEQSRIDWRLNVIAAELPFRDLAAMLTEVSATASPTDASDLLTALNSLQNIESELKAKAAEHNKWQRIEPDFWEVGDRVERHSPGEIRELSAEDAKQQLEAAIDDFKERWPQLRKQVKAIAALQGEEPWARNSEKLATWIDEALAEAKFVELRERFKLFRDTALIHFFSLDQALRTQCGQIQKIRQALERRLGRV